MTSGLDRKLERQLERDYAKTICDTCVPHKFSKFIYLKENFIELSQPHITYQKVNNIVINTIYIINISALKDHLRTIQYVYSWTFPKVYNRTNKFGIKNKLHSDFIFTNWRHHKSNLVLLTQEKNKVVEEPIKKLIPEIDITQQQQ